MIFLTHNKKLMFSTENITISQEVENYFKDKIVPLKDKFKNYKLVITGPISAGKSTALEYLYILFNKYNFITQPILEYINYDQKLGYELLTKYINKEISNSTFQNYILDTYQTQFRKAGNNKNIFLFERTIDDSIMCFANISHYNHVDLEDFDLYALYTKMKKLDQEYEIPNYTDKDINFDKIVSTCIEDTIISIIDFIENDIIKGNNKRIIGLSTCLKISRKRILNRGRESENNYTDDYLEMIINYYEKLYNKLIKKEDLTFTCLDELIK